MIKEKIIDHVINCSDHEIDDLATFIAGMEAQKRALAKMLLKQYDFPDREPPPQAGKTA
jgi:hypothetical protein